MNVKELYQKMCLIRCTEETILDLYSKGVLHGTAHAYIGQEADAVGIIAGLNQSDIIWSNHRSHGHYIAFTDDVEGLLAEILGSIQGPCSGLGGSQHLCNGTFFSNGIQGGITPCAAGMAFAEKIKNSGNIVVVFLGDGTFGQGIVYESLNIASLWSLPILFIVENNYYAQTTHLKHNFAGSFEGRAKAFGLACSSCTTTDVTEIYQHSKDAIKYVREQKKPYMFVINTYRLCPHSKGDDHRSKQEIDERMKLDPLRITEEDLEMSFIKSTKANCIKRIQAALRVCGCVL